MLFKLTYYLYPERMLSNVVFPEPEGPKIAVNSPSRNWPLMLFNIVFSRSVNKKYNFKIIVIEKIAINALITNIEIMISVFFLFFIDKYYIQKNFYIMLFIEFCISHISIRIILINMYLSEN